MKPFNGKNRIYTGSRIRGKYSQFATTGGVYDPNDILVAQESGLWRSPTGPVSGSTLYLDAGDYQSYPGTGTTWYDLSGNGYNGTMTNLSYNTDYGGYLYFDGTSGYCTTPYADLVDLGANWTIFVFAKIQSAGGNHPFFSSYNVYNGSSIWGIYFLSSSAFYSNQLILNTGSAAWQNNIIGSSTKSTSAVWKSYAVVGTNFLTNQAYTFYYDGNNSSGSAWVLNSGVRGYWYTNQNDSINSCGIGRVYPASTPGYDTTKAHMDLGAILIYRSALTGVQIQQNHDYFKARYGL